MTNNSTTANDRLPVAYITGDWGHIFDGDQSERLTRIVIDAQSRKLIRMEVQRNRSVNNSYTEASRIEVADVEDSLVNANSEVFDTPADFGLISTNDLPDWAALPASTLATPEQQPAAYELTFAQFAAQAVAEKLTNHGRRWNVTLHGRDSCFSDADTQEQALRDAHRSAINNALYFNLPDSPSFGDKPSIPPAEVLAEYPDVVERFPELGLSVKPATNLPVAGIQMSML